MRKKKTLYEVNRWNRPAFMPKENLFAFGAPIELPKTPNMGYSISEAFNANLRNFAPKENAVSNPLSFKDAFGKAGIQNGLKSGAAAGISAGAGIVGGLANGLISGGLNSGAGSAISGIGSTVGSAVGAVNPLLGAAVTVGSGILGGVTNALFGEGVNEQALKEANEGTAQLNSFVSNAGSFDDIKGPQAVANVEDAYSGGLFTSGSARRKNEELKRQRAEAKMFADRSILNNVNNLAADQLNNALATYAAFGGPIETIGNNDMGAIGYGFMSDYLASKKKQAEQKEKMSNMFMNTPSLFADGGGLNRDKDYKSEKKPYPSVKKGDFAGGGRSYPIPTKADAIDALRLAGLHHRPDVKAKVYRKYPELKHADGGPLNLLYQDNTPLFAFGGDMQTNGADYGTGLTHIDAGGSHEENKYDGVQLGTDSQNVPNLVEEGEVVWDDYVFSNRIELDEEAKKKFHFPKKKSITYAEAAKKLEKEIAERVNDPISQAGFNAQMQTLEEEQERQKQEMEAERAKAAFEALSPEEQVAVMENAAQQEQTAQQAAMQQEAMAQQQAQPSPEEQAMMQQQMMAPQEQMMPVEEGYAYGGNLFDEGGYAWLKKNVSGFTDAQLKAIARVMDKRVKQRYPNGLTTKSYINIWRDLAPTFNYSKANITKYYNALVADGLDSRTAYELANPRSRAGNNKEAIARRDALYKELAASSTTKASMMPSTGQTTVQQRKQAIDNAWAEYVKNPKEFLAKHGYTPKGQEPVQMAAASTPAVAPKPEVAKEKVEAPAKAAEESRRQVRKENTTASKSTSTPSGKGVNVGGWNIEHPWDRYGLPGAEQYVLGQYAGFDTLTDEEKKQRALETVEGLNSIQESYWNNVVPLIGRRRQERNEGVGQHQQAYHQMTGNVGFRQTDDDGHLLLDTDLSKPAGHYTGDNLEGGWVDFFSGPQTEQRYFGATGDNVSHLVDILKQMGIDYSPYNAWTIGKGEDARQLYRASLLDAPAVPTNASPEDPVVGNGLVEGIDYVVDPQAGSIDVNDNAGADDFVAVDENGDPVQKDIVPIHKDDNLRYAGLFGPAVGLGMMAAGIGKPDYSGLDAAVQRGGNVYLADYKPIGNYLTYRPMDIWYQQNALNAQARATDRALQNTASPSKMAGLIANGYNSQLASGDLYRKALEYNDAKRAQVGEFNRGTDMFNAQAYNQNQQFNASARNRADQYKAGLAMSAAQQKLAADAGWHNSLYGNVAGLFKGIGELGRENYQYNQMVDLLGSGALPGVTEDKLVKAGLYRYAKEGGRVKRKKGKRGLTI